MNPDLDKLQLYPFEKLAQLKAGIQPPSHLDHIALSIGEPKHPTASMVGDALLSHLHHLSSYPATKGIAELRNSIANWLSRRFKLPTNELDPERHILPVNGTREALFAFAQTVIDRSTNPLVLMPNPFYQIYEGAALLAGAEPVFLACTAASDYLPDFNAVDKKTWQKCQLLYLCSPSNPTGAVIEEPVLHQLIELADQYDFIIAADECYSEIYADEEHPPHGLLQAASSLGNDEYKHCVVFHSLSKRSNAPGLRSGFVAGDADILNKFLRYRTYHGSAMSVQNQYASMSAWNDEVHVVANRRIYQQKFNAVLDILDGDLDVTKPAAGFYLWPRTPIADTAFAKGLYAQQNITVLPGSYLSREIDGLNPGENHIRMALVPPMDECLDAARRIKTYIQSL